MTFSGSSEWDGAFVKHVVHPKEKDERHPEHMPNHIQVQYVTQLTDDEIAEHDENPDNDLEIDELVELGDGQIPWLVGMGWVGWPDTYEFVVWSNEAPTAESAKRLLVGYFT